jgi:hypothetical protein
MTHTELGTRSGLPALPREDVKCGKPDAFGGVHALLSRRSETAVKLCTMIARAMPGAICSATRSKFERPRRDLYLIIPKAPHPGGRETRRVGSPDSLRHEIPAG